jgi:hypothetical protein
MAFNAQSPLPWHVTAAIVIGLVAVGAILFSRPEIRTRRVKYRNQICTEYFDLKDGMPVRAECPSRGAERYVDTLRNIRYAPNFPVTFTSRLTNDR